LRHATDSQVQYDYLLSSLPGEVIGNSLDLLVRWQVKIPDSYEHLKARMLETHVLSNFKNLELLLKTQSRWV
jgi:hypothetical protein